jgi:uncharacterized protein YlxW (UPF0749 family)
MKEKFLQSWQYPVAVGCIIIGLLVSWQFKLQKREGFPFYNSQRTELIRMIRGLESERNKLQLDLAETRARLENYIQNVSKGMGALKALQNQMKTMRMQAGLSKVEGPALVVRLQDSDLHPARNEDPYFFLVHDVDLVSLINELWAAGAEAISINEQRIIASSSIRCAGPTILVNSVRLVPPYEVKAIGPATSMEAALRMPGGWYDSMAQSLKNGVKIKIVEKENLVIPAYEGALLFRYAKEVREDEK